MKNSCCRSGAVRRLSKSYVNCVFHQSSAVWIRDLKRKLKCPERVVTVCQATNYNSQKHGRFIMYSTKNSFLPTTHCNSPIKLNYSSSKNCPNVLLFLTILLIIHQQIGIILHKKIYSSLVYFLLIGKRITWFGQVLTE